MCNDSLDFWAVLSTTLCGKALHGWSSCIRGAAMSENKGSGSSELANGFGALAAIFCFFLGYDYGGWPGAAIAALVAFGAVHLVFAAISLAIRLAVAGILLLLMLVSLKHRLEWLASLAQ